MEHDIQGRRAATADFRLHPAICSFYTSGRLLNPKSREYQKRKMCQLLRINLVVIAFDLPVQILGYSKLCHLQVSGIGGVLYQVAA
jgi:hypothetical protein